MSSLNLTNLQVAMASPSESPVSCSYFWVFPPFLWREFLWWFVLSLSNFIIISLPEVNLSLKISILMYVFYIYIILCYWFWYSFISITSVISVSQMWKFWNSFALKIYWRSFIISIFNAKYFFKKCLIWYVNASFHLLDNFIDHDFFHVKKD